MQTTNIRLIPVLLALVALAAHADQAALEKKGQRTDQEPVKACQKECKKVERDSTAYEGCMLKCNESSFGSGAGSTSPKK